MHKTSIIKLFSLAAGAVILTGCADMSKMDAANSMAQQAMERANAAYALARQASTEAGEANYNAQQAQETADAGLECCNSNAQKMDRMFENVMTK